MSLICESMIIDEDDDYQSDTTLPDLNRFTIDDDVNEHDLFPIQSESCRNGPISRSRYLVYAELKIAEKAISLKVGDTWQLRPLAPSTHAPDFIKIRNIIKERRTGKILVRGWRLRRNTLIYDMLPKDLNEVCVVVEADEDDPRPVLVQGQQTISIDELHTLRKLVMTNELFPAYSVSEKHPRPTSIEALKIQSGYEYNLVCRWILITKFRNSRERLKRKKCEQALIRVDEEETDKSVPPWRLLAEFRGSLPGLSDNTTMIDAFSGAGGISEGARRAGIKVVRAIEIESEACATYRENHPQVEVYEQDISLHIQQVNQGNICSLHPDILHGSPSCKAYSAANTQVELRDPSSPQGNRDEQNQATLLATGPLLDTYRPRIYTMEQTNHLQELATRNQRWLRGVINQITSSNYSVRWRILNLAEYGTTSTRKRLIFFAAAPGEELPEFPAPTHGPDRAFPFKTIHDAIKDVRPHHTHHDPANVPRRNKIPYPARSQLRNIVTGGGTTATHPNGRRVFTRRELARLQGLHLLYKFNRHQSKTVTNLQLGNMVPADAARTLFTHLKKHLVQSNEKLRKAIREVRIFD